MDAAAHAARSVARPSRGRVERLSDIGEQLLPAAQGLSRRPMFRLARGHLAGRPPPSNAAASA